MKLAVAYVYIAGNRPGDRIGMVRYPEQGYYPVSLDNASNTATEAQEVVDSLNDKLGIPRKIAKAALVGSMFGWGCPAAEPAKEWFSDSLIAASRRNN